MNTGATRTRCPDCGAEAFRQRDNLPLVTADTTRLTPGAAAALAGPGRRAWCLHESRRDGARLVEVSALFHSPVCGWAHVMDHQCPPGGPRVAGFR